MSLSRISRVIAVEVDLHPIGIILKSNAIKGIRFKVSKKHWRGTAAYNRLPEMVVGEMVRCISAQNTARELDSMRMRAVHVRVRAPFE